MKRYAKSVSFFLMTALLINSLILTSGTATARNAQTPDLEQIASTWPVEFEDTFDQPTANWDAPAGNYMNYEVVNGRFAAKDTFSSFESENKGQILVGIHAFL